MSRPYLQTVSHLPEKINVGPLRVIFRRHNQRGKTDFSEKQDESTVQAEDGCVCRLISEQW